MITFNKTAFKHDVSKADIEWAIKTAVFDRQKEGKADTFLLVGFSRAGIRWKLAIVSSMTGVITCSTQ